MSTPSRPFTPTPWELHPALTDERLRAIARLVQGVCHDAAEDQRPEKGDSTWSLGCVRYARLCSRFRTLVESGDFPWLGIATGHELFLGLYVDGVPVRIYHGETDVKAPAHYQPSLEELRVIQLSLLDSAPPVGEAFRLIYSVDGGGELSQIWFAQVNDAGSVSNPWRIPVDARTEVVPFRKAPVEQAAPVIKPIADSATQKDGA